MKNIIILIVMLLAYSAIAEAKVEIKRFEVLKTQDGKVQFCKESSDYYQPGTYSLHGIQNTIKENTIVDSHILAVGKKCSKYSTANNEQLYIWKELSLFSDYDYEIMRYLDSDFVTEYVTVKSKYHTLVVVNREFKVLTEVALNETIYGRGETHFTVDLTAGILEENLEQFHMGKTVSSVLFVFIKTKRTHRYSWSDEPDSFLFSGPSFSFIYFVQKQ